VFRFQTKSVVFAQVWTADDSPVVPFLLTWLLGQPNPNGKKRVSQTAVHFVHLLRQTNRAF